MNAQRHALLVIDLQEGVLWDAYQRAATVGAAQQAVDFARAAGLPIVWVQHDDEEMTTTSPYWQLDDALRPATDDFFVHKRFRDAFDETPLLDFLRARDITHLYICGAQTEFCVRHTSLGAMARGFDITVLADAHTTGDATGPTGAITAASMIDELNRAFDGYERPGASARVLPVAAAFSR